MSIKVGIRLDDLESYHTSGEFLHGNVVLDVKKRVVLAGISMRMTCDVNSSIEVNVADPDKKPKVRVFTTKERLYDKEMSVRVDQHHFEEGTYEFPFEFPLPLENAGLPPSATTLVQPNTFGNINYNLKAHAKRVGGSWFSSSKEAKAVVPFLFMPSSIRNAKYENKAREEPFAGVVPGSDVPIKKKGVIASLLGRKGEPRLPLELKGVFSYSLPGIVQGQQDRFGLRVQAGTPDESIMIMGVSLYLETVLVLTTKGNRRQQVIKSEPLVQEKLLRSENSFNLDDIMAKARVLSGVVPTFDTSAISYRHQVLLELLLLRPPNTKQSDVLKFTQEIPVRVLPSPVSAHGPTLPARPAGPVDVKAAEDNGKQRAGQNGFQDEKRQAWPSEKRREEPTSPASPTSPISQPSAGPSGADPNASLESPSRLTSKSSAGPSSGPSAGPSAGPLGPSAGPSGPSAGPSGASAGLSGPSAGPSAQPSASDSFVPIPDLSTGLLPDPPQTDDVPHYNPPDYQEAMRE